MARQSYLLRRGGSYSARIRVPCDLVPAVGRKELVRSLGTRDPSEAKRLVLTVVADWHEQFDHLRSRRKLTPDAALDAAFDHHQAILGRDDARREAIPTQADVEAALEQATKRAERDGIDMTDPLQALDASLDVMVTMNQRKGPASVDALFRRIKLRDLRRHLGENETALVEHEVDAFLARSDASAPHGSPERRDLARKLMRAEIDALQRTLERDEGDYSGEPGDQLIKLATARAAAATGQGETIGAALAAFQRENAQGVSRDRLNQIRHDVNSLIEIVGPETPVAKLSKAMVREWKGLLTRYPTKAAEANAFKGMSIREAVAANETIGRPVLSDRTVNRYLSSVGALCRWCVSNGLMDTNPVTGMALSKERQAQTYPFTPDHLTTLFAAPLFTGCQSDETWSLIRKPGNVRIRDYRFWVPLMMLYSGARPSEIGQLATSDVRQEHGHWIMHITMEGDGTKTVKTKGSMRVVPIHSKLIDLGFLDYRAARIAAGDVQLFPGVERNERGQMFKEYSRNFSRYLASLGIKEGRGHSLYSFRHGAVDALRRAGHLDEQFGFLMGHAKATMTGRYGMMPEGMLKQRIDLVEAIEYPGLDLSHLQ